MRAEIHGVADVAGFIGDYQHGQLPFHYRDESFEFDIAFVERGRAFFFGLGVVAGAIEPVAEGVDGFVVFLLDVGVGFFFDAEAGEIEAGSLDRGPIDHHGDGAIDLHFVHGPSSEVERGSLPVDEAAALQIEPAGAGGGDYGGDAVRARDGNVRAGGIDGGGGYELWVVITEFADVHGGADGADFVQTNLGNGVEHAGINFQAGGVNDLGI